MERVKAAGLLHTGLDRYEVFDFQADRLEKLKAFLAARKLPFSFHVPFFRPSYFPHTGVSTFFLNDSRYRRELSFQLMKSTLHYAKGWKADFVVTHLVWKDDSKDRRKVLNHISNTNSRFSDLSDTYNIPINVEFGGYSGHFHEPVQFVEFVSNNPLIGICLDIGHTFLISKTRNRNFLKDIETLAPQTKSIHVWNTKGLDHCKKHNHIPVHPSQKTGDGWIDIKKTLEIILEHNKNCNIVFEYNHTYFDKLPVKVKEGMDWVRSIAKR
ncbi:MAG: sugar phosphate isomerase/epimerase [Planctomycetes bacterium]|nr:sugar phosphate isomerase/epimerase [Planctomycetota bacterium]